MKSLKTKTVVLLVLAVSLLVLGRQLVTPAVFSCLREDTVFYLNWSRQAAGSLASGIWYPRWMPESHNGYGNPTFIFYPPLVIYLTAILKLITGDLILSATLVKLLGLFLSGLFMYIFINDIWGPRAGLVSAILYMVLPFRVFDLYFLGVYASKFAYVWFPLILYFTRRAVTGGRMGMGTAGLAVTYALLCLTHLLSAYMFLPVLIVFGLMCAGGGGFGRASLRLAAAGFLSLSLAAFYLVPAFLERSLVHFEMLLDDEIYHYWNNYLFFIFKPISPFNPFFYRYIAITVILSAALGLSVYLLPKPSKKEKRGALPVFFLALVVFTLFIMSSPSGFLWATVPGMGQLQFPTRWASVLTFGAAGLAGAGFINKDGPVTRSVVVNAWIPVFIVCAAATLYYDADIIRKGCCFTKADLAKLPSTQDVEEYVPADVSLKWLRSQATNNDTAKIVPQEPEKIAKLYIKEWDPASREFYVEAADKTRLRIRTFYYPGWQGEIGGRRAVLSAETETGAILLTVPKGRNDVRIWFADTPERRAAKAVSALACVIVLLLAAVSFLRQDKQSPAP